MSLPQSLARENAGIPDLLRELIGFRTVNPPGEHYGEITEFLVRRLRACGLSVRRFTPAAKLQNARLPSGQKHLRRHNVLGFWRVPGAKRTLHFNAHYDVVPVGGAWSHGDAFSGAVSKGWIYGRGTADMKGSIASLFTALQALRASGLKPRCNVEVSFTADEETDSVLGAEWLVDNVPLRADAVVVMEGAEGDHICCGHNGVVWLEVEVLGRAAHGSRPDLGVNALEKMAALILAFEDYKRRLGGHCFVAPDGSERHPTVNLGGVFSQGEGGKINTVPASARFSIDRRVLPDETAPVVERELRAFLAKAAASIPGCRIRIHKVSDNHPCFSNPEGPLFQTMASCLRAVRRREPVFTVSTGFTDMQFFAHKLGLPVLGYGPGGLCEHAVDERARLKDLAQSAAIYARLMLEYGD